MPAPLYFDESPRGSVVLNSHLRRRSSVSLYPTTASHHSSHAGSPNPPSAALGQPFVSHLVYDDKTGEISLPSSTPTHSWRTDEKKNLGEGFTKPRNPPYRRQPKGRPFVLPRPWLGACGLGAVTLTFCFLLTYLVPSS